MRTHFLKIVDVTDVTLPTNFDSQQIERIAGYSVQIIWTSTSVDATFKLEASNDNANWDTITGTEFNIVNDSNSLVSDSKLFNLPEVYYKFFRPSVSIIDGTLLTLEASYFLKGA